MEITILEKKENPLLNREEVTFKVDHTDESTPSRSAVVGKIAAMMNSDKERTIIKDIRTGFGVQYAIGHANIYDSLESAKKVEHEHYLKRNGLIEADNK